MGRFNDVTNNTGKLQSRLSLADPDQRDIFKIGLLTDISETLALLVDVYMITHGVNMTSNTGHVQEAPPRPSRRAARPRSVADIPRPVAEVPQPEEEDINDGPVD